MDKEQKEIQEDFIIECISYQIELDITRGILVVLEEDIKR